MRDRLTASEHCRGRLPSTRSHLRNVELNDSVQPILSIKDISKHFGGVTALDDVSFDVDEGECHALVGENGAGKTTLINILSGDILPDAGHIEMKGAAISPSRPADEHLPRDQCHPPGARSHWAPERDGKHLRRRPQGGAQGVRQESEEAESGREGAARHARVRRRTDGPRRAPEHVEEADRGDREGPIHEPQDPHHGRADLLPHQRRDRKALPASSSRSRRGASRSSSSPTV